MTLYDETRNETECEKTSDREEREEKGRYE
jgi:hypothetical protein